MDIKELLGKDSSELEKLTDAQLLEYFSPYMKFIVPVDIKDDNEKKSISVNSTGGTKHYATNEAQKTMDMAQRLAKQMGIKI